MSDVSADSSALAPHARSESWPARKFIFLIAFALALHVAFIFVLGTKKTVAPRPVTKVPHLQLADSANEFVAFSDPTLFARPNAHDFATAFWQRPPTVRQPGFNWTESPRWLLPAPENLGAAFREFMRTNPPPETPLNFKPEPQLVEPAVAFDDAMPQKTTMQISGELAGRLLPDQANLPPIRINDVIPPSVVQVLVDTAGNVASAVPLPDNSTEAAAHNAAAEQRALQLARNLRFAPAPKLVFGEIIFNWHTVPTNAP